MARTLDDLISGDSAWPIVVELIADSPHDITVLNADQATRADVLLAAQVTTHSVLGALIWNCGVVAIDHGWVRLIGAGVSEIQGAHAERLNDPGCGRVFDGMIAAYDVLGGRFAIHGGGLDEVPLGEVVYWAPDTLRWEPTGKGHSAMVQFLLSLPLAEFYADLRWDGWEKDISTVALDQGLSAYPFAWSAEGRGSNISRRAVPMAELIAQAETASRQISGHPDGTQFEIKLG